MFIWPILWARFLSPFHPAEVCVWWIVQIQYLMTQERRGPIRNSLQIILATEMLSLAFSTRYRDTFCFILTRLYPACSLFRVRLENNNPSKSFWQSHGCVSPVCQQLSSDPLYQVTATRVARQKWALALYQYEFPLKKDFLHQNDSLTFFCDF